MRNNVFAVRTEKLSTLSARLVLVHLQSFCNFVWSGHFITEFLFLCHGSFAKFIALTKILEHMGIPRAYS